MILLTDEETAFSFTKGFEECEVPLFRPPNLSREIELRQKAGDKSLILAQAKKIFDEAKRQGIIDVYNGNLITIDNSGKHWNFWSELKKEIESNPQ